MTGDNWYDYYSCPYEPDTGPTPCGEKPECNRCSWSTMVTVKGCENLILRR